MTPVRIKKLWKHEDALVAPPLSGYALPANGLSMSGLDLLLSYYFIIHMP